jgi:hypothetical protein
MFLIMGYYEGNGEVVDEADTRGEAEFLAREYRMAFGPGWCIEVVRS